MSRGLQNPDPIPDLKFRFLIPCPRLNCNEHLLTFPWNLNFFVDRKRSLFHWVNDQNLRYPRQNVKKWYPTPDQKLRYPRLKRPNYNPKQDKNHTLSQTKCQKMIPYLRPKRRKSISYSTTHTHIANIGKYPPGQCIWIRLIVLIVQVHPGPFSPFCTWKALILNIFTYLLFELIISK